MLWCMKRLAFACLLLLTACQKKDPEGTIQPTKAGGLVFSGLRDGDSVPFRLLGGDTTFTLTPDGDSNTEGCASELDLIPYGQQTGQRIAVTKAFRTARMNGVQAGVYFIRMKSNVDGCRYAVNVMRPR